MQLRKKSDIWGYFYILTHTVYCPILPFVMGGHSLNAKGVMQYHHNLLKIPGFYLKLFVYSTTTQNPHDVLGDMTHGQIWYMDFDSTPETALLVN